MSLSQKEVIELFDYKEDTGVFLRKLTRSPNAVAGDVAGSPDKHGYLTIYINGKSYKAHRLAWLYVYGEWPTKHIDHINGVKFDNRISNLRDVSVATNLQNINTIQMRHNKYGSEAGLLGVIPHKGRWRVQFKVNGKHVHVGVFNSPKEANAAYMAKRKEIGI